MDSRITVRSAAAGSVALLCLAGIAGPAAAKGGSDETIKRGSCAAASDWKLKAKSRDGGLEVEFEVDSNRVGQVWTYTIRHDGSVKASGKRTTRAPSGSFSVERRLPDAAGRHTITATASNSRTGETCRATLRA